MPGSDQEWRGLVEAANAISTILKRKPKRLKSSFRLNPGSILNAYREGDITFHQAVKSLEKWKGAK